MGDESSWDGARSSALLPACYAAPRLVCLGVLRQLVRGSGTPQRADFSSLDVIQDPNNPLSICVGSAAQAGGELSDVNCLNYKLF